MGKKGKLDDFSFGQWKALATRLAKDTGMTAFEIVTDIIHGRLTVEVVSKQPLLFDRHGRRIPPLDVGDNICDPERSYKVNQPDINYGDRLARFNALFGCTTLRSDTFRIRAEQLMAQIEGNLDLVNLMWGPCLPIVLPQESRTAFDYGTVLERRFLSAVKEAYQNAFPDQEFRHFKEGKIENRVRVVGQTRHHILIEKMNRGPVVALFFPTALQGYSIHAAREQMNSLPSELLLAGGFDVATAIALYPDVLAGSNAPGLQMSAVCWNGRSTSFCFRGEGALCFDTTGSIPAGADYSSGLTFIGSDH